MAVEDAYVLSNLLGKCTSPKDLSAAFKAYDHVRVPRTMRLTNMSREQGKLLDMEGDGLGDDLEKIAAALQTRVRWIWDVDLEAHLEEAVAKFNEEKSEGF